MDSDYEDGDGSEDEHMNLEAYDRYAEDGDEGDDEDEEEE